MRKIALILLIFILLIPISTAILSVTPIEIGTTYIKWEWSSSYNISNISIDGYKVCSFDTSSNSFILSELNDNSTHKIIIYNATDSGNNSATTTITATSKLITILWYYIYFVVALILLIFAISLPSPVMGFLGVIIMAISFIYNIIPLFRGASPTIDMLIYGAGLMISVIIGLASWR